VIADKAGAPVGPAGVRVGLGLASEGEQARYIRRMFGAIAPRYDLANTLISAGLHRRWKRETVRLVQVPSGGRALDICCGTGDLAILLARRVGSRGSVLGVDFSEEMLQIARRRAAAAGVAAVCRFAQADAEGLAVSGTAFDVATMGFGLRNVVHPETALREACRALRPGGRLAVLEFSRPTSSVVRQLYDLYSFTLLPCVGRLASRHSDAYLYLPTSIRAWPDQDALAAVLARSGFARVQYWNLCTGIAAVHIGTRPSAARAQEQG
jgi:demethylmenaquinone methyltransferase / 2-methoxy-6-polyprenyl-1,4-benzoquinol methylase